MRGSLLSRSVKTSGAPRGRGSCRWLAATLALVAAGAAADAHACVRRAGIDIGVGSCEPYARAVWMPAETAGHLGGVPYALGLARLNRDGLAMTGHDAAEAPVVPVLALSAAPGMRVALMPTRRMGDVGASVIVSLRLGR